MSENDKTIQVTLKYGGVKGGRLMSGMTNKTEALHVLLADLNALRAHRPKGENIRQEGASFFLVWLLPSHAPVNDSLYKRWVAISKGSSELDAVKRELSIESVTVTMLLSTGTRGTNVSPLGPKHTIELSRTEGMSLHAENLSLSFTSDRSDIQKLFTTEVQRKRPRSNSINEQSVLSPPFGSDGSNNPSSNPLLKRIRTEQHLPIQNSTAEGKHTLDDRSTGDSEYQTTQVGDKIPQFRHSISRVPLTVTSQQPLHTLPYHTKPFPDPPRPLPGSPDVNNSFIPTGPHPPGDRGAIDRLSLELSKVRSQLTTLKHCEEGISEELVRLGAPQPRSAKTVPSSHGLVYQ
ncbi:hypothetical protein BDR04DRAFT_144606 [Suillus decipiens]|nr:hypothetical protein BDR04DRAFT_144606 [Suillus decipiens]